MTASGACEADLPTEPANNLLVTAGAPLVRHLTHTSTRGKVFSTVCSLVRNDLNTLYSLTSFGSPESILMLCSNVRTMPPRRSLHEAIRTAAVAGNVPPPIRGSRRTTSPRTTPTPWSPLATPHPTPALAVPTRACTLPVRHVPSRTPSTSGRRTCQRQAHASWVPHNQPMGNVQPHHLNQVQRVALQGCGLCMQIVQR